MKKYFGTAAMRSGSIGLTLSLVLGIGASGCAHITAPKGWLPRAEDTQIQAHGGWATVTYRRDRNVTDINGELIAVNEEGLLIMTVHGLKEIPREMIREFSVAAYQPSVKQIAASAVLGTLSTASHGRFALLSAPVWVVSGSGIAARESREPVVEYPKIAWEGLSKYARFPQGLTEPVDRQSLRPKPHDPGRADRPFWPFPAAGTSERGYGIFTLGGREKQYGWREVWSLEISLGRVGRSSDRYHERLEEFGFEGEDDLNFHYTVSVARAFDKKILGFYPAAVASWNHLWRTEYDRRIYWLGDSWDQEFEFSTHCLGIHLRITPHLRSWALLPYIQLGGGLAVGVTELRDEHDTAGFEDREYHYGYHLEALAGLQVVPWKHFGFFGQGGYITAPVIENLVGDRHESGGWQFAFGIRGGL